MWRTSLKMNVILCVLFSTLISCISCELLKLKDGAINGTVGKSKNGRSFYQFYSIPYAEPPVGELRLKPPVAPKPWSGVKDATKWPPKCIQTPVSFFSFGAPTKVQEDCLYLNVFVPNDLFKPSGKAAVMVWIHGGSFQFGSSEDYNPEYFMDKDVILVTINYRLGALGFFGMNNDVISGNFGLKDQALALQWVKENIAAFGGDPDKVTLIGESAGAASVHLHMFSPLSKGLFQKAIMQSGSALSGWAARDYGFVEALSTSFLVISGCFRNDSTRILKCLQNLPANEFLTLGKRIYAGNNTAATMHFKPVVESNVKNNPFLPQVLDKSTYLNNVPWIGGINSGEGAMGLALLLGKGGALENVTNVTTKTLVPVIGSYLHSLDPENVEKKAQKIVDFYFSSNDTKARRSLKFVDIVTDSAFLYPLIETIQSSGEQKYVYFYDHRGSFSWQDFAKLDVDLGVSHADELPLLFRSKILEAKWNPQDKLVSEKLLKFWTEFAIKGDPNGESEEKLWKPTNSEGDIEYLHIKGNSTTMEKNILKDRYEFWESLYHTND
ncbi:juvenile hormone esterase-like [Planococcus citri]|uniref:juvenile hormone esterase-like n=1 Tax=Planococcus citri TaxID=170843 RepID=UPI0031F9EE5B